MHSYSSLTNTMATLFQIWIIFTSLVSYALPEKKGKTKKYHVLIFAYFSEHFWNPSCISLDYQRKFRHFTTASVKHFQALETPENQHGKESSNLSEEVLLVVTCLGLCSPLVKKNSSLKVYYDCLHFIESSVIDFHSRYCLRCQGTHTQTWTNRPLQRNYSTHPMRNEEFMLHS